ncbi:hypothetical protein BKP45_05605 [Anaerobacillus alkalidiazotrophicus]|uniref:Uncharacterized protein n=1 Tax=Anaerobacillus alkalidiazotrophicus TaxID=472963 RepID=A0A1S2MC26_9BACI|nr:hypothetical protein BKP45_05605 [Anaerobacillus alkalidiazotrophicus]
MKIFEDKNSIPYLFEKEKFYNNSLFYAYSYSMFKQYKNMYKKREWLKRITIDTLNLSHSQLVMIVKYRA